MHGLKAFDHIGHGRTEPFEHGLDHMIPAYQNTILVDLRGEMAVAQMPGKMAERHIRARLHLVKLFLGRDDLDRATVLQHKHIAVGEQDRLRQVDHHLVALVGGDKLAAQVAIGGVEDQRAERLGVAGVGLGVGSGVKQAIFPEESLCVQYLVD